jgi:hypothetical protein
MVECLIADLRKKRDRADRLEAALAEVRRGWLERLVEALQRRPSQPRDPTLDHGGAKWTGIHSLACSCAAGSLQPLSSRQ